jgi:hypothetical protein
MFNSVAPGQVDFSLHLPNKFVAYPTIFYFPQDKIMLIKKVSFFIKSSLILFPITFEDDKIWLFITIVFYIYKSSNLKSKNKTKFYPKNSQRNKTETWAAIELTEMSLGPLKRQLR